MIAVTTSAFAVVVSTTPAAAVQPVPVQGTVSDNVPVVDCGAFQVSDEYTTSWSGHLLFDRAGNPVRIVEHLWGSDRLYNPVNGSSVSDTINASEIVDIANGQAIEAGQDFRVLVPGVGALFLDIGRFVIDFNDGLVFLKGRHQFFGGDVGALCAALS